MSDHKSGGRNKRVVPKAYFCALIGLPVLPLYERFLDRHFDGLLLGNYNSFAFCKSPSLLIQVDDVDYIVIVFCHRNTEQPIAALLFLILRRCVKTAAVIRHSKRTHTGNGEGIDGEALSFSVFATIIPLI